MPSASRIDAFSGSRRFAFSSGTVACAFLPGRHVLAALLEEVVRLAHRPLSSRYGTRQGLPSAAPSLRARVSGG